jgi:superfamily II DNA or RNA helicase
MTFKPKKVYNITNKKLFRIAHTQEELIEHIQFFGKGCSYEDYFIYNNDFVEKYFEEMRKHQTEAISALCDYILAQCIIPTACGKTRIQIALLLLDAIEKTQNNETGTYVVGNHRLTLSQQLLWQIQEVFVAAGLDFDILSVNSDNIDNSDFGLDISKHTVTSTTTTEEIKLAYMRAKALNRHLIIVSTYHSFDRLKNIGKIDIATFDEAHETVKEDFSENVFSVTNIEKKYFFTATPRTVNGIGGMANEAYYGKVVYQKSPREMIDAGEMVSPKIHIVDCENNDANSENMSITTTINSFKYHQNTINNLSKGRLAAKLLVSTGGTTQIKDIHNSKELHDLHEEDNVHIIALATSDEFGYYYNFEKMSRANVYDKMMSLRDEEKAIILHIDTISEGMDVPGITGVAIYRKLGTTKLLQTIGRCLRLFSEDRKKLYSGEMLPTETDEFIKPFGFVIIPNFFEKQTELECLVHTLYRDYGIKNDDITHDGDFDGAAIPFVENVTEKIEEPNIDKQYSLFHIIKSIQEDMVSKVIENMTLDDLLFC